MGIANVGDEAAGRRRPSLAPDVPVRGGAARRSTCGAVWRRAAARRGRGARWSRDRDRLADARGPDPGAQARRLCPDRGCRLRHRGSVRRRATAGARIPPGRCGVRRVRPDGRAASPRAWPQPSSRQARRWICCGRRASSVRSRCSCWHCRRAACAPPAPTCIRPASTLRMASTPRAGRRCSPCGCSRCSPGMMSSSFRGSSRERPVTPSPRSGAAGPT